ncbi:Helix-turn-helix type 11 domain protein [Catenulispora acidiphila DSM 44928]|uniref:Helix-turn-helix type 11 domain protein n=1 Tax=Catenulispora acidiphila (strain DSM 44928 / JCM 14897 / NBRC 102108 / NRRL B-24433 / ID139908) TaxID=479433 RepID=C7Q0C4_CATAD|nr:YafY family protein [Catenulispora acidiphila]ACU77457.1 Helix-turn-helix type 11 domain protein [Catenulispora acidiphila DSM 44928]
MLETSARLLRLLSLFQARRDWTGGELAERLGVTTRTVRNDVERLRELGYPVEARPGVAGGYRLGSGATLPPLLLDDDEAVAVALGLRIAAAGAVAGIEETSLSALAKLQRILPARLRHRVESFGSHALAVPTHAPTVDPETLTTLALACRDHLMLHFDYEAHSGATSRRTTEPYRLIHRRQHWYLFAWDPSRADWRTFRADRIHPHTPPGPRFTPRPTPPDAEITTRVDTGVAQAPWRYKARVIVHAPATYVRTRIPTPITVEELPNGHSAFEPGSDNPERLALYLGMLEADFEVTDAPELAAAVERIIARYQRAIGNST